jgi:hypothetical protein
LFEISAGFLTYSRTESSRRRGRAPRPGPSNGRRLAGSRLRPGVPAALPVHRLRLLPSGPDRVHGSGSRRTRPSTLLAGGCPVIQRPQTGSRPGVSRVSGDRGPRTPRVARPRPRIAAGPRGPITRPARLFRDFLRHPYEIAEKLWVAALSERADAETKGFEPLDLLRGHTLSRRAG